MPLGWGRVQRLHFPISRHGGSGSAYKVYSMAHLFWPFEAAFSWQTCCVLDATHWTWRIFFCQEGNSCVFFFSRTSWRDLIEGPWSGILDWFRWLFCLCSCFFHRHRLRCPWQIHPWSLQIFCMTVCKLKKTMVSVWTSFLELTKFFLLIDTRCDFFPSEWFFCCCCAWAFYGCTLCLLGVDKFY